MACLHLENYKEAIEAFEEVLQGDMYDLQTRFNLVLAYARNHNEAAAEHQVELIDKMAHTFDFSELPAEEQQQWKNVQTAIQSLKEFLLGNIKPDENKEPLS